MALPAKITNSAQDEKHVDADFRSRVDLDNLDNTRGYKLIGLLSDEGTDEYTPMQLELTRAFTILAAYVGCNKNYLKFFHQLEAGKIKNILDSILFNLNKEDFDSACSDMDKLFALHQTPIEHSCVRMLLSAVSNNRFRTITINSLPEPIFGVQDRETQIKADLDLAVKFMKWQLTHRNIINGGCHQDYVIVNSIVSQDIKNILFILFVNHNLPENYLDLVKALANIFKSYNYSETENLWAIIKNKLVQIHPKHNFDLLDKKIKKWRKTVTF